MNHKSKSEFETTDCKNEIANFPTVCKHVKQHNGVPVVQTPKQLIMKDSKMSWAICMAAFSIQVFDVGIMHIFGVFFVVFVKDFKSTKAEAAWIGSACYGLALACGPLSGLLMHRFGNVAVSMSGAFICALAMVLTSFVKSLNMLYLTFSIMYGIGCSLAYTPTMCISGVYFEKYVSFALGIMTAGSSFGTLILAPISQVIIDSLGWRNTFRILGGFNLMTMMSGYMFKPAVEKVKSNQMSADIVTPSWRKRILKQLDLCKSPLFGVWVFAICCVQFGYYIPYVHLVARAEELGLTTKDGATLMMCLGCSTCIARIVFGKLSDSSWFRHLHMFQGCIAIQGVSMIVLPLLKTFSGLLCYVFLVGMMDGCYVVCMPVLTFKLMGLKRAVLAWGFMIGASSVTFTLGPPIAGWIYDATLSYELSFHVAGVPVLVGAFVMFSVPWLDRRYGDRQTDTVSLANGALSGSPDMNVMTRPLSSVTLDRLTSSQTLAQSSAVDKNKNVGGVDTLATLAAKKLPTRSRQLLTRSRSDMYHLSQTSQQAVYSDIRSHKSADVHFPTAIVCKKTKEMTFEMTFGSEEMTAKDVAACQRQRTDRIIDRPFTSKSVSPVRTPAVLVMNPILSATLSISPKECVTPPSRAGTHNEYSAFHIVSRSTSVAVDRCLKMEDVVAKLDEIANKEAAIRPEI